MALQRNEFVTGGDMRTPVAFYKATPTDDFFPGETVEEVVLSVLLMFINHHRKIWI